VHLQERGFGNYDNKFEQLPTFNFSLHAYLQTWKYFIHVEHELKHDLTFRSSYLKAAKKFLENATPLAWKKQNVLKVVIHVRRGDLINKIRQKRGWAKPNPGYFNRSMDYYRACHPRVLFVVLSNDIRWCRRNVVGDRVVYSVGRSPLVDMAIASLCDHAIITMGTFSWWVAWFAGGITVTQKNFPTPDSFLARNYKDHYKPEWVSF